MTVENPDALSPDELARNVDRTVPEVLVDLLQSNKPETILNAAGAIGSLVSCAISMWYLKPHY